MYVLCAAEWSFRAISYCFVHRRTSRFGSRFGSKRDFKNMVELFDCKMQEKAPKSSDFGAFYGGQYRTRTCDPMHVKHVLIPAELTVHQRGYYTQSRCICQVLFFRYHAISGFAVALDSGLFGEGLQIGVVDLLGCVLHFALVLGVMLIRGADVGDDAV